MTRLRCCSSGWCCSRRHGGGCDDTCGRRDGADVIGATITDDGGTFTITATVRSTDTGWDKYADAWQVRDGEGNVFGERVVTHPHENEQPFTRIQSGIVIPEGLEEVTIAARDSVAGFCGEVFHIGGAGPMTYQVWVNESWLEISIPEMSGEGIVVPNANAIVLSRGS